MGLKIVISQVQAQLAEMDQDLNDSIQNAKALKREIQSFLSDMSLKGEAYKSARNYFRQTHLHILSQMISTFELIKTC